MKTKLVSITVFLALIGALSGCKEQSNIGFPTPIPKAVLLSKGMVGVPAGTPESVLTDIRENLKVNSNFNPAEGEISEVTFQHIALYWRDIIPKGKVVVSVWKEGNYYAALFSPNSDTAEIPPIGLGHWEKGGKNFFFHLKMIDWYRRSDEARKQLIRAPRGVVTFQSVSLGSSGFDAIAVGDKDGTAHIHLSRTRQRYARLDGTPYGGVPAGAFQSNISGMVGYGDIIAPKRYTPEEIEAVLK